MSWWCATKGLFLSIYGTHVPGGSGDLAIFELLPRQQGLGVCPRSLKSYALNGMLGTYVKISLEYHQ